MKIQILNLTSPAGHVFTKEAIQNALSLFEGMSVNLGTSDGSRERLVSDRVGRIHNVRMNEDGACGDLHILPNVTMPCPECGGTGGAQATTCIRCQGECRVPLDISELRIDMQSHAICYGRDDGVTVVTKITDISSLDLVPDEPT